MRMLIIPLGERSKKKKNITSLFPEYFFIHKYIYISIFFFFFIEFQDLFLINCTRIRTLST